MFGDEAQAIWRAEVYRARLDFQTLAQAVEWIDVPFGAGIF